MGFAGPFELHVGKGEVGVAETVAETPQRIGLIERGVVRMGAGQRGKVEFHLARGFRHRAGEFAAGVVGAKQHVDDRLAALHAGIKALEDRGAHAVGPIERIGSAADMHDDNGLAGRCDLPDEVVLSAGEIQAGARAVFPGGGIGLAPVGLVTDHDNGDIRALGERHCLVDTLLLAGGRRLPHKFLPEFILGEAVASFRVEHMESVDAAILDRAAHCGDRHIERAVMARA